MDMELKNGVVGSQIVSFFETVYGTVAVGAVSLGAPGGPDTNDYRITFDDGTEGDYRVTFDRNSYTSSKVLRAEPLK